MFYNLHAWGSDHKIEIQKTTYADNGNLAIQLWEVNEGPYARLTVNLGKRLPTDMAFVDTNNCRWAEDWIQDNGLGVPTGEVGCSGWCVYPLYRFNLDKM